MQNDWKPGQALFCEMPMGQLVALRNAGISASEPFNHIGVQVGVSVDHMAISNGLAAQREILRRIEINDVA